MPGLMKPPVEDVEEEAAPGDEGAPAEDMDSDGAPDEEVSPEEQAQYDKFVDNGYSLIYDKKSLPTVLKTIEGNGDFVEGLGQAASTIVLRLKQSAEEAGQQLSPDVMYHGGIELLEDMADLAEKKDIHKYTPKEVEASLYRALDIVQQSGSVDKKGAQQELAAMAEADKRGDLDRLMPGLKRAFGQKASAGSAEPTDDEAVDDEQEV